MTNEKLRHLYIKLVVLCAHYFLFLLAVKAILLSFFNGDVRGVCVFDERLCLCIHFQCFVSKSIFQNRASVYKTCGVMVIIVVVF